MKLHHYRVYYDKGIFNCSTNRPASLVYRCYADVDAVTKKDAINEVLDDLAEELRLSNMTLTVHQDTPTYLGWEAYARYNELHRVMYGQMMTSERITIYDRFRVKELKSKEGKQ